jgi:cell division protein FtsL
MDPHQIAYIAAALLVLVLGITVLLAQLKLFEINKELRTLNHNLLTQAEDARDYQGAVIRLLEETRSRKGSAESGA